MTRLARRVLENPAGRFFENPATSAAKRTLVQARTGKDNDVTGQLSDRTLNWQDRTGQDRPMK